MKSICLIFIKFSIVLLLFVTSASIHYPAYASVSGGTGHILLSPASGILPIGQDTSVDVLFNTTNTPVSGIQVVLKFPVTNPADLGATIQMNSALAAAGWQFPVKTVTTSGAQTTIEIMGLNTGITGYAVNANTKLATIIFSPSRVFSGKAVSFDSALTKLLKKSDASDMVATPANGSFSTSGVSVTNTPTPIVTNTPTQSVTNTPSPTGNSGTSAPNCSSLYTNIASSIGTPVTITLTCSGTEPTGYISAAEFTFGDGKSQVVQKNVGGNGSISISHSYTTIGTLGATCRVRNNSNTWSSIPASCAKSISIKARPASMTTGSSPIAIVSTSTPTPFLLPSESITQSPILTQYDTPTLDQTPYPTSSIAPVASRSSSDTLLWIAGGVITILLAFLLLRRKNPPQLPPQTQYPSAPPTEQQYQQQPMPPEPQAPVIQN